MKLAASIETRIGSAAAEAAADMVGSDALGDVMGILTEFNDWQPEVHFLCVAGDAQSEALYRFMVAKGRCLLPIDGWLSIDSRIRSFFDYFSVVAVALARLLAVPDTGVRQVVPRQTPIPIGETIFERNEGRTAQFTQHRGDPRSTADVPVFRAGDQPKMPLPAPPPAPVQILSEHMDAFVERKPPSREEFMAMTAEQRRPYAALFGLATFGDQYATGALLDAPPAIEGETQGVVVDAEVNGEKVAGVVAVTRGRPVKSRKE